MDKNSLDRYLEGLIGASNNNYADVTEVNKRLAELYETTEARPVTSDKGASNGQGKKEV